MICPCPAGRKVMSRKYVKKSTHQFDLSIESTGITGNEAGVQKRMANYLPCMPGFAEVSSDAEKVKWLDSLLFLGKIIRFLSAGNLIVQEALAQKTWHYNDRLIEKITAANLKEFGYGG
jgi:hypothetical protein